MRVSKQIGRLIRQIAALKRWSHKTAAEAAVEHFAAHLGIGPKSKRSAAASEDPDPT